MVDPATWTRHPASVSAEVTCRVRAAPSVGAATSAPRELPKIVQFPGAGPGVEVLPRTRRNHGCDNHRRTQEGGSAAAGGGRKLPQIPQPAYNHPHHPPEAAAPHLYIGPEVDRVSYEAELTTPRQRSLPRTPRERKVGAEQVRPAPASSHRSPKRAAAQQQQRVDQLVPDRNKSHDPNHPHSHHHHQHHHQQRPRPEHEGVAAASRKPHRHSRTTDDHHHHHHHHRSSATGGRSRSEGGQQRSRSGRSRMRRQSPVEERLSVHEDDSMSDAFDDDGLFQIDENFAKFLDDKTSCQK